MRAKRENASMKVRIVTIAICLSIVVLLSVLSGHQATTGGDPCVSGNTPQVCEAQQAIDKTHAIENTQSEGMTK